jgi:hypothetical protein
VLARCCRELSGKVSVCRIAIADVPAILNGYAMLAAIARRPDQAIGSRD